jgi:hypothetical protein
MVNYISNKRIAKKNELLLELVKLKNNKINTENYEYKKQNIYNKLNLLGFNKKKVKEELGIPKKNILRRLFSRKTKTPTNIKYQTNTKKNKGGSKNQKTKKQKK